MPHTSPRPVRRVREQARDQALVVLFTVGASSLLALVVATIGMVTR